MRLGELLPSVFGFLVGLLIASAFIAIVCVVLAFGWMAVFVSWLEYDYVTVSSVYFVLVVTGLLVSGLLNLLSAEEKGMALLSLVFVLIAYPLAISAGLGVYEAWKHPAISAALNVVGIYRHTAYMPVSWLGRLIAGLGPAGSRLVDGIESSELLTQIVAAVVGGVVTQSLGLFKLLSWGRANA